MKRLMVDLYKVVYKVTREKYMSVTLAVIYTSLINFIIADGLCMLLEGWIPTKKLHRLFTVPYGIATFSVLLLVGFWRMPAIKLLRKERKKEPLAIPLLVYSCIGVLLFLYIRYSDKLI